MRGKLSAEWRKRPWWMNLILCFCLFMTFVYMPFDMFVKPVAQDQEVWFGLLLEGAYGFWTMRTWMWPWGAVYALQVAISMLLWSVTRGSLITGLVSFAVFMIPTVALYRTRELFRAR